MACPKRSGQNWWRKWTQRIETPPPKKKNKQTSLLKLRWHRNPNFFTYFSIFLTFFVTLFFFSFFRVFCNKHRGIGFYVKHKFVKFLRSIRRVSDRIALASFFIPKVKKCIVVICVYGPTLPESIKSPTIRNQFYEQLQSVYSSVSKRSIIYVCGDWNSKVGRRVPGSLKSVGR